MWFNVNFGIVLYKTLWQSSLIERAYNVRVRVENGVVDANLK